MPVGKALCRVFTEVFLPPCIPGRERTSIIRSNRGSTDNGVLGYSHCQLCTEPSLNLRYHPGACMQIISFILMTTCDAGIIMIPHFTEEQTETQGGSVTCLMSPNR